MILRTPHVCTGKEKIVLLEQINRMPWQTECDMSVPYRTMTVQIGFLHRDCESDEVEFSINAWDVKELTKLFEVFVKEYCFKKVRASSISIIRMAPTMDALIALETKTQYQ